MDKLYYVVCEEQDTTLFEGRYQGRTRGGTLKFLKDQIGRKSLKGLVFTITEIPVPLIREIVAEILAGSVTPAANVASIARPESDPKVERYDAFDAGAAAKVKPAKVTSIRKPKPEPEATTAKVGNPGHGEDYWRKVRAHWEKCRNIKETAAEFGLPPNSVKTRAYREGWRK
jgi:hypothetical protein